MTDADSDTAQAVIACWKADATLATLFLQPPIYDTVRKDPARDARAALKYPYASLKVEKDQDAQHMTGGAYHDYRKVTIRVAGAPKAVADQAKLAVLNVFNLNLGRPGKPTLALPSGAAFRRWWPLNDGEIRQDESRKDGQDVWIATVIGRVWSVRTV